MIKAIIFDMDGVLIDTSTIIVKVYRKAFEDFNVDIDDSIKKLMGIGSSEVIKRILEKNNIPYSIGLISEIEDKKEKANIELMDQIKVLGGVNNLLLNLEKNYVLALASSNSQNVVDAFLDKKGFRKFFSAVVTKNDVDNAKPNPEIFLKASKKLNINAKNCLVIEDSIYGISAAKKAEMKSIGVATGAYKKSGLAEAGADFVVDSLKEQDDIMDFIKKN